LNEKSGKIHADCTSKIIVFFSMVCPNTELRPKKLEYEVKSSPSGIKEAPKLK
jgi:hypothetical protein